METFGIIGFVFGLSALAKVIMLENRLKESGIFKEQTESDDNQIIYPELHQAPHSWGFLFVGGWVDLDEEIKIKKGFDLPLCTLTCVHQVK